MKTLIVSALVATLGFAGAASAMTQAQVEAAQETLDEYGFSVDAHTLSAAQASALATFQVDTDIERTAKADGRAKNSIRAILN